MPPTATLKPCAEVLQQLLALVAVEEAAKGKKEAEAVCSALVAAEAERGQDVSSMDCDDEFDELGPEEADFRILCHRQRLLHRCARICHRHPGETPERSNLIIAAYDLGMH